MCLVFGFSCACEEFSHSFCSDGVLCSRFKGRAELFARIVGVKRMSTIRSRAIRRGSCFFIFEEKGVKMDTSSLSYYVIDYSCQGKKTKKSDFILLFKYTRLHWSVVF